MALLQINAALNSRIGILEIVGKPRDARKGVSRRRVQISVAADAGIKTAPVTLCEYRRTSPVAGQSPRHLTGNSSATEARSDQAGAPVGRIAL
jgi:hypothetical protein